MTASATDPNAWISELAREAPQRPFLIGASGEKLSYGQLAERTAQIADALARLGVGVGDRVALQLEKSPEALLLGLACLRMGAVLMPLNTAYTAAELDDFIGDAEPALVIVQPAMAGAVAPLAEKHRVARLETLGVANDGTLPALLAEGRAQDFAPFCGEPDALAALLYTSGTTGRSKGAMITRRNLASNAVSLVEGWQLSDKDVLLHALPIFHVHGLFISTHAILAAGASLIFLPKFDADEVLRRMPDATVLMGVPTFYTRLLQCAGLNRDVTSSMRLFVSGSAPLLAETHRAFTARTGHAIVERYGMTETQVNASHPYDGARVPGTVGRPLPGVDIRITDLVSGEAVKDGEAGMIEVRGPNVFKGYWRNPEKTAAELRGDGWFLTGDVGRFDSRGYLSIVGRAKDLIITGGYNVYPIEVEAEIDKLPGVIESAVIGLPHADFGEAVTAIVRRETRSSIGETDIITALQQVLARYKLPKRVVFVDELPRNALGKVQKNVLRAQYAGATPPSG